MADNVEIIQTNISIETNEAKNLVEFRYYGVNEAALAALIPRVWALEDFQDQLEADLNAAIAAGDGPLQTQLDALEATVTANAALLPPETAARIAGDAALGADILALDTYLTPLVLAEPADRDAAIAVETAARVGALSALDVALTADIDAVAVSVAAQTATISALGAQVTALDGTVTTLSGEFDALSTEFGTWTDDFTDVQDAVIAETAARIAADNAITAMITTPVSWKAPVRAATTASGTLASSFEVDDVVDGVTLALGDRILIKDQAAGEENGIYTVNTTGAPTRATDMDVSTEVPGAITLVAEGTVNGDTLHFCSTNSPITLGTTALVFTQVSAGISDGDKGDITVSAGGTTWTIDAGTVTLAKMANMNTGKLFGRSTAGAGSDARSRPPS